jgi:hypothetical protein
MAAADTVPVRLHPLPLFQVIYEQLVDDAGPAQGKVWVRAQSSEHAAWKAANLVSPHGWELVEVIRIR